MQFELSLDYLEKLKEAISDKDNTILTAQLNELYEVDIALILNRLDLEESIYLYNLIEEDLKANVLLELEEDKREAILSTFSTKEIAEQLDNMDSDDAADVINPVLMKLESKQTQ
jgi:magnesium transporter